MLCSIKKSDALQGGPLQRGRSSAGLETPGRGLLSLQVVQTAITAIGTKNGRPVQQWPLLLQNPGGPTREGLGPFAQKPGTARG